MSYIKAIPTVLSKTTNYTVSTNDGDNVHVNVDATGGTATITFYAASGNTGKIITVKKTDSSANAVVLDGNASETLDGATTLTLSAQHDSATLVCDGTNWIKASAMGAGAIPISGMAAGDDIYASSSTQLAAGARQLRQTFRGLTLRTHPDADVAAYKVFLDHADEIVLNDGTRVADWDDLAADITASGAGGLDTGSEGASRWYSIHAIRKSSDGTKGLLLHRAKDYFLDETYDAADAQVEIRKVTNDVRAFAQTFDTDVTGEFPFADVKLIRVGTLTGTVWASVYATSGGVPTGSALTTSDLIDPSLIATSAQWVRFIFRTPETLTAGTTYALVISGSMAQSDANYLGVRVDTSSPGYAAGQSFLDQAGVWTAKSWDASFKVYVTQNDTALTMPSGYDQYAQIGWVYNDSGSNFIPMFANDRDVRHYSPTVSAVPGTIPTLVSSEVAHPPVPVVMTTAQAAGTTAGADISIAWAVPSSNSNYAEYFFASNASYWFQPAMQIPIEFQFFYYRVSAGNLYFYPTAYRW